MIKIDDIQDARRRIADSVLETPCLHSSVFSQHCEAEVYFKYETLQVTGSFKARGALNTLRSLSPKDRAAGVIAASAGNHAQGVAWAASQVGCRSIIVMPETTPVIKINRTEELGAEVVLYGSGYDDAFRKARAIEKRDGLTFVHAFNDERVIAGQGTTGLEILEQVPDLDAVVVPIGGGGQIAGIATAIKAISPQVAIYGVQTQSAPAVKESFDAGRLIKRAAGKTLAEGIAIKHPGPLALRIIRKHVEAVRLVSEPEIEETVFHLAESGKIVVEGAGAAGVAALLHGHFPELKGKRVAIVLCGANIDPHILSIILERQLTRRSRLFQVRVRIPNSPGGLAAMLRIIADAGGSVVRIRQDRIFTATAFWDVEIVLTLEARHEQHSHEIVNALRSAAYEDVEVIAVERAGPP